MAGYWTPMLAGYLEPIDSQDNRNMCAPPFRRDRAMASDTIAKLCRPADQIR
jgi:hypothetical protein